MTQGSRWFRRFVDECKKMSPHIRIKRIKFGFYRIFIDHAYIHEVYSEMPQHGHDIYEKDMRFQDKKYYEVYEDRAEITRKIKNYVEGYWDSIDTVRTRLYMYKHDKEFNNKANERYKTLVVK